MSRKSQYKLAIKNIFNTVFVAPDDPLACEGVTYTIEDAMIQLQSFYHGEHRTVTGGDVLKYMIRNITNYMDGTPCKLYVFTFDKPNFVFKVKGIEHRKRAQKRRVAPAPDPEEGQCLLPLDESIPYNWSSMMANRKTRRALIHQITMAIIDNFYPPAGKLLVVDGGLLDEEDQPVVIYSHPGETGKRYMNSNKSVLLSEYDIKDKENCLTKRDIRRPDNLRNQAGEADICYLFYLNYFWETQKAHREKNKIPAHEDPIIVDVLSHDTDFIPISLSYFHNVTDANFRVRVFFNSKKKNNNNKKDDEEDDNKNVLLVDRLYERVRVVAGRNSQRPELGMISAMMSSGNDYVDGYVGLVPSRTLGVYFFQNEYIGNLVDVTEDGRWDLNYAAYLRLLKAMYCDKYKKAIAKEVPGARGKKGDDLDVFWRYELTWKALREVVKNHNVKNTRAHIPSPKTVWLRFLRLQFNLEILRIGYKSLPDQVDLMSLGLGFSLIQKDKPIAFHNVRVTEEEDDECRPERKFLKSMGESVPPSPIRE